MGVRFTKIKTIQYLSLTIALKEPLLIEKRYISAVVPPDLAAARKIKINTLIL
jgi:hypothetical protein